MKRFISKELAGIKIKYILLYVGKGNEIYVEEEENVIYNFEDCPTAVGMFAYF